MGSNVKHLKRRPSSFLRAMQQQAHQQELKQEDGHCSDSGELLRKDRVTQQPAFLASRTVSRSGSGRFDRSRSSDPEEEGAEEQGEEGGERVPGVYARRTGSGQVLHVAVGDYANSRSSDLLDSPERPDEYQRSPLRPGDEGGIVVVSKGGKRLNVRGKTVSQETASERQRVQQTTRYNVRARLEHASGCVHRRCFESPVEHVLMISLSFFAGDSDCRRMATSTAFKGRARPRRPPRPPSKSAAV